MVLLLIEVFIHILINRIHVDTILRTLDIFSELLLIQVDLFAF